MPAFERERTISNLFAGSEAMIPARLTMRNFLCYRDNVPPLDFTGIHLACLAGDNGHGKPAILDAITWALWGKSRARTDDELIHAGQTEAEVDFEFLVDDVRYRVIRQRRRAQRSRPGVSSLELFVQRPTAGAPFPATRYAIRSAASKRSCTSTTTPSSTAPS